jgi:hypothetical protein
MGRLMLANRPPLVLFQIQTLGGTKGAASVAVDVVMFGLEAVMGALK